MTYKRTYDMWKNGQCFLTDKTNPTLTVVRDNGKRRWLNHCYFKIRCGTPYMNKTINDFYCFAVYEKSVYRGTFLYSELRDKLKCTHDECNLVAYPRKTKTKHKYRKGGTINA